MNSKRTRCLDSITPTWNLDQVIAELRQSREHTHNVRHLGRIRELPSRKAVLQVLDGLCAVLFPTHYGRTDLHSGNIDYFVGDQLHVTLSDPEGHEASDERYCIVSLAEEYRDDDCE